jgi:ABC-type transport system substrate-binding protein
VLTLSLISPDVPFLKRAGAEAVKEWQAAGIQVAATEASVDTLSSEEVKNRTFEAMLWGQVFDATFDLYPFWHSSQRFAPGLNLTLISDPLLDSSLETYRENMDANKRDSALLQAEDRANQSFLFIPLFSPRLTLVHTSDLRGLPEGAANEPADFLTSAANWYVHTTRKLK